ncbi:MAG: thiamine pyrophosphokinase [Chloroflexi bacterium]|nr:MAG: thiamine pyrophosphokinase [Chloroflexota bacterium]
MRFYNIQPFLAEGFYLLKNRAVIFANGEISDFTVIEELLKPDDDLIAVDGGLRHICKLEKNPQLLIGDFDSIESSDVERLENQGVEIRRFPIEKDETDLELALLAVARKGYREVLLVGALGGRLDHTLANLFLLLLPALSRMKVTIETGTEEIFLIRKTTVIRGDKGDVVSLIPLKGNIVGVQTKGLKYHLENETLYIEKSRGISNVMLEKQAEVTLISGCLLCIHSRKKVSEEK